MDDELEDVTETCYGSQKADMLNELILNPSIVPLSTAVNIAPTITISTCASIPNAWKLSVIPKSAKNHEPIMTQTDLYFFSAYSATLSYDQSYIIIFVTMAL